MQLDPEKFIIGFIASIFIYIFSGPLIAIGYITICAIIFFGNCFYANNKAKQYEFYALAVFMLYCLVASYYSIDIKQAIKSIIKASLILSFLYFTLRKIDFDPINFNSRKVIISMLIVLNIIMIIEYTCYYPIALFFRKILSISTNLKQPIDKASFLISLILPAIYIRFYKNDILYWCLVFLTTMNYLVNPVLAGTISYFFAGLMIILCYYLGRKFILLYFSGMVAYLYSAPFIFKFLTNLKWVDNNINIIPESWMQRIVMWRKATKLIEHNAFIGYGFNCSEKTNNMNYFGDGIIIQLHPHNVFLQLWLETGLIGIIIISVFLALLFKRILAIKDKKSQFTAIGLVSTLFVYGNISYGLWQSWLLCSISIAVIIHKISFDEKSYNSN
jgi:O-antigen ligase